MAEPTSGRITQLRVVSYNVHSCVGLDGEFSPARIANILKALSADVVALQEVEERNYRGASVSQFLADALGLYRAGRTIHERAGIDYGNVLLSRLPALSVSGHDLMFPRREPRGAIEAEFELESRTLRVLATHFGLAARERRAQLEKILGILEADESELTVLCADFNEWVPWSRTHRLLGRALGRSQPVRTFPSRAPGLSLDRIYVMPADTLIDVKAVSTAATRVASDHLPLVADIALE